MQFVLCLILICFFISSVNSNLCEKHTDCTACTSDLENWCNWCPVSRKCHDSSSIENKCTNSENVGDAKFCGCKNSCKLEKKLLEDTSICKYYTKSHPIGSLPEDPKEWFGGDYLPHACKITYFFTT